MNFGSTNSWRVRFEIEPNTFTSIYVLLIYNMGTEQLNAVLSSNKLKKRQKNSSVHHFLASSNRLMLVPVL